MLIRAMKIVSNTDPREDRHRHRLAAGHLPRLDHGEYRWHLAERPLQRFPKHLVAHRPDLCGNGRRGERRGRRKLHRPLCVLAALRLTRSHTAETGTTGPQSKALPEAPPFPQVTHSIQHPGPASIPQHAGESAHYRNPFARHIVAPGYQLLLKNRRKRTSSPTICETITNV